MSRQISAKVLRLEDPEKPKKMEKPKTARILHNFFRVEYMLDSNVYEPWRSVDCLKLDVLPPHQRGLMKTLWETEKIGEMEFSFNQIHGLYEGSRNEKYGGKWSLSYEKLDKVFKVKRGTAWRLCRKCEKWKIGGKVRIGGRPSKLSEKEVEEVIKYVEECEGEKTPPEPMELLDWINETFEKSLSSSWMYKFLKRKSTDLWKVKARPLEDKRISLPLSDLVDYFEEAEKILPWIDKRLIYNCDEAGVGGKSSGKIKNVVSTRNMETQYKMTDRVGHVTVLPTIQPTGDHIWWEMEKNGNKQTPLKRTSHPRWCQPA